MAHTEIFRIGADHAVDLSSETVHGASRGALFVWDVVAQQFLGWERFPWFDEAIEQKVWALASDSEVPEFARITLLSTFDTAVVRREEIPQLVEAFRQFCNAFDREGVSSLAEQSDILMKYYRDESTIGVCWNQMTGAQSHWEVQRLMEVQLPGMGEKELSALEARFKERNARPPNHGIDCERTLIWPQDGGDVAWVEQWLTRPYNINRDSDHLFIFDELSEG